jgi:quercetin dioxygenase-like cupin family protein
MKIFPLDNLPMHTITEFASVYASIGGLARGTSPFQIGFLRLGPGGVLGMHPTPSPQMLLVLAGEGWVSGEDGVRRPVRQGLAVYWQTGEMHETATATGLTALVLESDGFVVPSSPATTSVDQ